MEVKQIIVKMFIQIFVDVDKCDWLQSANDEDD